MWELERHDWSRLRAAGSAERVPQALAALRDASSAEEAERAYWRIDNTVVVQGALYEAALPAVVCLLEVLQRSTPVARPFVLELLVQIGSGEPAPVEREQGNADLSARCRRELSRGVALFVHLLEHGSDGERIHGVDLLGLCAEQDPALRERVRWYLGKLLRQDPSDGLRRLIESWLAALE